MIFTYLSITNFMKLKQVEFELTPGDMIILQGDNGQGKSAIFEAMAFILTGHRKGSSAKHYIRRGEKKFELKAVIRKGPHTDPYEIEVVCAHNTMPPTNKSVTYQGKSYQNSEYDAFMKTQFDIDLINNITLTMQGDNTLEQLRPSQLRDMLKNVFKVSFDVEQEKTHEIASHYREKAYSLNEQIKSMSESLEILKKDEPILFRPPSQNKIDEARESYLQHESKVKELEHKTEGIRQKETELKRLQTDASKKKDQLERFLREREESKKVIRKKIDAASAKLDTYKQEMEEAESRLGSTQMVPELEKQLESIHSDIMSSKVAHHDLQHKLGLVDEGNCPTCGQALPDEWVSHRAEYEKRLNELTDEIKTMSTLVQEIEASVSERQSQEVRKRFAEQSIKTYSESLQELEQDYRRLEDAHAGGLWMGDLQLAVNEAEEHYQQYKVQVESDRESLEQDLADLKKYQMMMTNAKEEVEGLENDRRSYDAKVEILNDNHARRDKLEQLLKAKNEEDIHIHQDLEVYEVAEKLVDKYLPTFGVLTAGEKVVKGMVNIISPVLATWAMRLIPSRDGVYFEYREGEEDEYSPISMASGFEKALCNIAFKMTLTAYYGLPLMILDEIDSAAVDGNSLKVFDSIIQFKRVYDIHQVWLVSHKREVVAQLIQEYGETTQVYHVDDGDVTHTWKGGATV